MGLTFGGATGFPFATFAPDGGGGTPIRLETESLGRTGFVQKPVTTASGGAAVQLNAAGATGLLTADLIARGVAPGFYTFRVVYQDEKDGTSNAALTVNGATVGAWNFDGIAGTQVNPGAKTGNGNQPGNLRSISFDTVVQVTAGSVLSLAATRAGGELARIDYIELIPVAAPNAAPTDIALSASTVAENAAGAVIGTLSVVDPNAGDTHTLIVSDSRFEVVGNALKLKAGVSLDFEAASSVTVAVTATDAGGKSYSENFAIGVTNVNEAPTAIAVTGGNVNENAPGAVVGTLSAIDPDAGSTATFTTGDARFEIVGNTLKLKPGVALDREAAAQVTVSVTATDGTGLSKTQDVVVAVNNVNEAPTAVTLSNTAVAENNPGAIVGTLSVTDPDIGDTFSYAVSDQRFEVVGNQLKLKSGIALDFEATPAIAISVTATDAGGLQRVENFSVVVTNLNEAPTGVTLDTTTVAENARGAIIGNVAAIDPDAVGTYSFAVDDARFVVANGKLQLANGGALDFEATPSVTVNITVTDQGGLSVTRPVTINVTNVNEAPVINGPAAVTIQENTRNVASFAAADPDAGTPAPVVTIVGGADAGRFTIDANGQLAFIAAPDFEAKSDVNGDNIYEVTLGATDGTLPTTRDVRVTVANVVETDVFYRLQAESFTGVGAPRNYTVDSQAPASGGAVISAKTTGTVTSLASATGATPGNYTLRVGYIDETDGLSTATVKVDGVTIGSWVFDGTSGVQAFPGQAAGATNQLGNYRIIEFATPFAITAGSVISVTGTANGAENARIDYIDLRAVERPNSAPTNILLSNASIAENVVGGTVGQLSVVDAEGGPVGYSVNDNRFEIVNGALKLKAGIALDFEATPSINLTVTAVDDGNLTISKALTVGVTNLNEAPTAILLAGGARVTNQVAGAVVGAITVTDPDAGATHSFGVSDARFEIVGGLLKLKAGIALDFSVVQSVPVTVTATDQGGLSTSQSFTIGVNTPPTDLVFAGPLTTAENVLGASFGAVTVVDQNAADTYAYTLSDARFEVAGGVLKLKAGVALDFEAGATVNVDVTATDPGGLSRTETISIGVSNVNEPANAIGITFANGLGLFENARRVTVGTLNANDPDTGAILTYSVQDSRFTVEGTTLKLAANFFDYEVAPVFRLTVTVTDQGGASFTQQVAIPILDVNEAPIVAQGAAAVTLLEGRTFVGTYTGSDVDAGAVLTYFIAGGTDASLFQIDTQTGALSFITARDFETKTDFNQDNIYNVTVGVSDGALTGTQAVRVQIADVQEAGSSTLYTTKINFQPASSAIPEGYLADTGKAYNAADGYGWVTEASVADGTANGTIPDAINVYGNVNVAAMNERGTAGIDPRLTSYAHFEFPLAPETSARSWAWEHALANGTYIVKVAIGDTAGQLDSVYALNIEGQKFMETWVPQVTLRSVLVTGTVTVTDGKLTLDSIGGTNSEIQYIEIEQIADRTPGDGRPADADYSSFESSVATATGVPATPLNLAININPTASFALDTDIVISGDGVDRTTLNANTIKLYETLTGTQVVGVANTDAAGGEITFTPSQPLKENTGYTLVIDGVKGVQGEEFLPYSTSFATGLNPQGTSGDIAFVKTSLDVSGNAYSSLTFSPDGSKLYATSLFGTITRWDVDPATGSVSNEQTFAPAELAGRTLIGIAFDPSDPDVIWLSNNDPLGAANAADFSGKITRVIMDGGDAFDGIVQDYVVGLPRSVRDHVTNSIAFHTDPLTGLTRLYVNQGSNSATGSPDNAWGNRPERLLTAAVLEIDTTRDVSASPINVQTQDPNAILPPGAGAQVGYYNPFAANAPVKLYATGIRNAYDLVWHSNGHLYVAANGSAAGGNTPDNPNTPLNEAILGAPTLDDFLFDVRGGFYYGHPNPLRSEYVLNGGNPTAGDDGLNEVSEYPVGVTPPANYGGFAYDFSRNRSPNGAAEYTSDVLNGVLKGALLVVEYSSGNDIVVLRFDAQGNVIADDTTVLVDAQGNTITFDDPLDITVDAVSGRIYVISLADGTISLLTPTERDPTPPEDVIYEAEAAVITGGAVVATNQPAFSGTGFVDFKNPANESITWTFDIARAGIYQVSFRYALSAQASPDGRALSFAVNGLNEGTLPFAPSGQNFRNWGFETQQVEFQVGINTVKLSSVGFSGPNIDYLAISPAPLQELNTRPTISGAQADLSFAQGASIAFVLRDVFVNDVDPGDDVTYLARLKGGGELPGWLDFEPGTQTFSSNSNAPPGVYEIELVADDGQDQSLGRVTFAIEVVRQVNAADVDKDGVLNASDVDDDGDGVLDTRDPFQGDPSNGLATPITEGRKLVYDFSGRPFGADPGYNGFGISGFFLGGNRTPEQLGLGTPNVSVVNGALHIENAGAGDLPTGLLYGAQFGVDPIARKINISATFDHPYDTRAPLKGMNFGLLIGSGGSDNYIKLVLEGLNNQGTGAFIQMETVENGVRIDTESPSFGRPTATSSLYRAADADDTVTFRFELDTVLGQVTAFWSVRNGADQLTGSFAPITVGGDLLKAIQGSYQVVGAGGTLVDSGLSVGVVASSRGATNALDVDVLDITVEGLVTDPDIALLNKTSALLGAHGIFNFILDPLANNGPAGVNPPRQYRDTDTITIFNDGNDVLNVSSLDLTGPFKFLDATDTVPFSIAAGQSRDIEIGFDSSPQAYDPEVDPRLFKGELKVVSDDPDAPLSVASLAGYWQPVPEGNEEADFNELMEVLGLGTRADQSKFNNFDIYEAAGPDEILVPYWKIADGFTKVTVTQVAAFHDINTAPFGIFEPGNINRDQAVNLFTHSNEYNQSLLPISTRGDAPTFTFDLGTIPDDWMGDEVFGIRIAGQLSDPRLNNDGPGQGPPGEQRGHFIRIFTAKDEAGNVIDDTYVVVQDYQGINYDYQDNVYLVQGMAPVLDWQIA